jgi:hypothetical protein
MVLGMVYTNREHWPLATYRLLRAAKRLKLGAFNVHLDIRGPCPREQLIQGDAFHFHVAVHGERGSLVRRGVKASDSFASVCGRAFEKDLPPSVRGESADIRFEATIVVWIGLEGGDLLETIT